MITSEYFRVVAEVQIEGSRETIDLSGLSAIPAVGDQVDLDYLHGRKFAFVVEGVRHHVSNIGGDVLQQTTLVGRSV